LNERFSANASGSPISNRMASEPNVKMNELRTVCQNTGSSKIRWKFVKPM